MNYGDRQTGRIEGPTESAYQGESSNFEIKLNEPVLADRVSSSSTRWKVWYRFDIPSRIPFQISYRELHCYSHADRISREKLIRLSDFATVRRSNSFVTFKVSSSSENLDADEVLLDYRLQRSTTLT